MPKYNRKRKNQQQQQHRNNNQQNKNAAKRNKQNNLQQKRQQSEGSISQESAQHGESTENMAAPVGSEPTVSCYDLTKNGGDDLQKNEGATIDEVPDRVATENTINDESEVHRKIDLTKNDQTDHGAEAGVEGEFSIDQHDPILKVSDHSEFVEELERSRNNETIEIAADQNCLTDPSEEATKTGANESSQQAEKEEDHLNHVESPSTATQPSDQDAYVELKSIQKVEHALETTPLATSEDHAQNEENRKEVDDTDQVQDPSDLQPLEEVVEHDQELGEVCNKDSEEEVREEHVEYNEAKDELTSSMPNDSSDIVESLSVEISTESIRNRDQSIDRNPFVTSDSVESSETTCASDILDNEDNFADISDSVNLLDRSDLSGDIRRDDTQSSICDKDLLPNDNEEVSQSVPRRSSKSPSPALSTSSSATLVGEKEELDQNVDVVNEGGDVALSADKTTTTMTFTSTMQFPLKQCIVQEIVQTACTYRVESPKPMVSKKTTTSTTSTVKKSRSLGDDIFAIQELSDCSSTSELTDYQPVVSEASESEAESETNETYEVHQHPSIVSIQTFPINDADMKLETPQQNQSSQQNQEDLKTRRAKKRMAIETHFMPQFLNPRYLDSIKEESDHSDIDRKSNDSGDNMKRSATDEDLEDDVFQAPASPKHIRDARYPKSHLDFGHVRKHPSSLPHPSTSIIREETQCVVLEAKIIEQPVIAESSAGWKTGKIPESDAAEIVYIDSASSSSSDVIDPDEEEDIFEEEQNVRIQTPTIDGDQARSLLKNDMAQNLDNTKIDEKSIIKNHTPPVVPVTEENQPRNEHLHQQNQGHHEKREECALKTHDVEINLANENRPVSDVREEIIPKEISFQTSSTARSSSEINSEISKNPPRSSTDRKEVLIKTTTIQFQLRNILDNVERRIKELKFKNENKLKFVSDSKLENIKICSETLTDSEDKNMFASLINPLIQSQEEIARKLTYVTQSTNTTNCDTKELTRQDSAGSHCSGNSQNTVINKDTTTSDLSDFDVGQCPISGSPKPSTDPQSDLRTLRQLCLETLTSMPYGYTVLEELANVSESINDLTQVHQELQLQRQTATTGEGDMPYPLPELPKINDLEVKVHENGETNLSGGKSSQVRLVTLPPTQAKSPESKLKSPPPPPIPEQPKMEPWLGLPTEQDPNVLVCLSPSQRSYMNENAKTGANPTDTSADNLLDMHKKFVERRGYHEYTTEQVKAVQRDAVDKNILISSSPNITNTDQSSKHRSPSPPPVPPPPLPRSLGTCQENNMPHSPSAPIPPPKSTSTVTLAAKTLKSDDKNNHRLLAIIRDSKQPSSENTPKEIQHKIEVVEKSEQDNQQSRIFQKVQTSKEGETTTNVSSNSEPIPPAAPSTEDSENQPKMLPPLAEIEAQIKALQQLADGKTITEEKSEKKTTEYKTETKTSGRIPHPGFSYFNKPTSQRENFFSSLDDLRKKCEGFENGSTRRFSSFEPQSQARPPYCSQFTQSMPKRYSNIEKSTFESKKRIENGNVIYDTTDSKQEKVVDDGEGNVIKESSTSHTGETAKPQTTAKQPTDEPKMQSSNFITDFFKNSKFDEEKRIPTEIPKQQPQSAPPPSSTAPRPSSMFSFVPRFEEQQQKSQTHDFAYDEFRRRAQETARRAQSEFFDRDFFKPKDFSEPKTFFKDDFFSSSSSKTEQKKEENLHKTYTIPIKVEGRPDAQESAQNQKYQQPEQHRRPPVEEPICREHRIPIQVEGRERPRPASVAGYRAPFCSEYSDQKYNEKRLSSQNLDEWMKYTNTAPISPSANIPSQIGESSENITKPIQKEFEICRGRRANIRAPRLSVSTSNLSEYDSQDESSAQMMHHNQFFSPVMRRRQVASMYEQQASPRLPEVPRRSSLPQEGQPDYMTHRERELQAEFEKLEQDRRRLIEEMDRVHASQRMRRDSYTQRSMQRLPTLNEEESFRQQMQNEWLSKVAEREERRLQNIIKLTKPSGAPPPQNTQNTREHYPAAPMRKSASTADISDEFLRRVKERRSKLCMPSDSDWESGAESQPQPSPFNEQTKINESVASRVKVIEGQQEADIRQLPKHLREFAEFTTSTKEEHDEKTSTYKESTLIRDKDESRPVMIAPKFKAKAPPGTGVWTPHGKSEEGSQTIYKQKTSAAPPPPPPPPPVWSPQPSPQFERKEFRPINYESPKPTRKYIQRQESAPVAPPWSYTENPSTKPFSSSCTNINSCGYDSRPVRNPTLTTTTINSLQKAREGQIQKGASFSELSRAKPPKDNTPAFVRPNEVIYSLKHEYMSEPESENDRPKKMAQLGRRQYDGIGPTTKEGMPIVLRSEVKEDNQHKWYKRMYNTLHKAKDDDVVTIRYKTRRGRYPYKSTGYMSEPEPNYDSDYSTTMKYNTLDRRRIPSTGSFDDRNYGTMPNPVKPGSGSYKNQPGRIEDYMPGRSSISEKEKKEWWDEVMEIFNGWLEDYSSLPKIYIRFAREVEKFHLEQQKLSNNYAEGYLSRALKDQGYESDSHLVFRKKEEPQIAPLSPVQQRQAYRSVQAGGEPPLQGFRKPAPEKPKDDSDIEYYPITSTLTKIRVHNKSALSLPQSNHQKIICYPITNITRPLDLFAPFPKNVPSYVPVNPPTPPSRESSRTSAAMKIYASSQATQEIPKRPPSVGRHEACFQTDYFQRDTPTNKFGTITIRKHAKREPIVRSKSAGTVTASKTFTSTLKEEKTQDGGTRISRRQQLSRVSSVSPRPCPLDHRKSSPSPVAFGRSISKERTFAEEKKRLEQTLPISRKTFPVSTSILRNPALKSPDQVKQAVRRSVCQPLIRSLSAPKKLSPLAESSFFNATATKNITKSGKKEDKQMKMSVSMASRGRDFSSKVFATASKKTTQTPSSILTNTHTSRAVERKSPKRSIKANSTMSLARTSSTFSVDSTSSRRRFEPKKPLTISRSASRERNVPMTIVGSKARKSRSVSKERLSASRSEGNVVQKISEREHVSLTRAEPPVVETKSLERKIKQDVTDSIVKHQEHVRSDQFFQNLFLRDASPVPSITSSTHASTSVQEKAKYWDSLAYRSEPSLPRSNIYLTQKRPVTDSKFLSLQTQRHHQSRSLSPVRRHWSPLRKDECDYNDVYRCEAFYQLSDQESEFGERKLEAKVNKFEKRSLSEPRSKNGEAESFRSRSPAVIYGKSSLEYSRSSSPTRYVRSPSRRRIQSFRDSHRTDTKKVIRASSLSSADARSCTKLHEYGDLPRSSSELNFIECHGSICPHNKSERFKELSRFYCNLERVGQLERATSSTDLRPIRPEGEVIDFDLWKKLRAHEKAERELHFLVGKLKEEQREKDLFFRPKDPTDLKWHEMADTGLRNKDKSVEDLRVGFERKAHEEGLDEVKRMEIEATKDTYKPFWRGNSVVDLASNMVHKYNQPDKPGEIQRQEKYEKSLSISSRLMSTLTKDQVNKIKNQLSEIYSGAPGSSEGRARSGSMTEDFVITVDGADRKAEGSLKVRCNSTISKEELLGPVLRKKQAQASVVRSESTSVLPILPPRPPQQSKSFKRLSRHVQRYECDLSEGDKKRLSQSLSREIQDKVLERRNRAPSPVITPRETRGAIAAEAAKSTMPDGPPQRYYSLEYSRSDAPLDSGNFDEASVERKVERKVKRRSSLVESESNTSELSKATVIYKEKPANVVHTKIKYFEEKKTEEPPKTIYHAREYSSPDEEEVLKAIEEKLKGRGEETQTKLTLRHRELSSSVSDFKELFGEKEVTRTNFPIPPPPPPPDEHKCTITHIKTTSKSSTNLDAPPIIQSPSSSSEYIYRSRSASPRTEKLYRAHLSRCKTGDVKKITDKFESLNECTSTNFFELSPVRRIRSDPELNNCAVTRSTSPNKVTIRNHETGDVSWITHKFETRNSAAIRGRSRTRHVTSPIPRVPLRKDDRLMPHIDIISKTAALKQEMLRSTSPLNSLLRKPIFSGEVERIRTKFESPERSSTLLGQMYTSTPDISELKDISSYLSGSWIAHKYPKPRDNARSPVCPEKGPESEQIKRRRVTNRPSSASPPRDRQFIKSLMRPHSDIFADQKFDPSIHRPKSRYVPDQSSQPQQPGDQKLPKGAKKPMITFKDTDVIPPPPPIKGIPLNGQSPESPRRYIEHDVNIHYKSPIRYEYKEAIPEEELARKQAEAMKKLYQEERRRKYLQELQDMNSRRHTDNFTPSQKSPIPLNRYDDFNNDLISPKSPNSLTYPRTVARALYNFQGQTARELTFKKGDIIYIRRQIDKNWYEGEHNAMIGLLPANYVEIITRDGVKPAQSRKPTEGQARAKFNFSAQSAIELSLNKGELVTLTRRVDENWFEGKVANRKGIFPVSYVEVLTDIGTDDFCQTTQSKPVGTPAAHSLVTYSNQNPSLDVLRTNLNNEFNNLTNGHHNPSNGILRETKSVHKTEVLHVDTNSEPVPYRALYKYRPQNNDELELNEGDIVYVLEKCDDGWYVGTSQRTGYFGTFPGNYVERV